MDLESHSDEQLIAMRKRSKKILHERLKDHSCENRDECYVCLKWSLSDVKKTHWCPKPQACDFCLKYRSMHTPDGDNTPYVDYDNMCNHGRYYKCYACFEKLRYPEDAYTIGAKTEYTSGERLNNPELRGRLVSCECEEDEIWILCNSCRQPTVAEITDVDVFEKRNVPILYVLRSYLSDATMAVCNVCGPKQGKILYFDTKSCCEIEKVKNPFYKKKS